MATSDVHFTFTTRPSHGVTRDEVDRWCAEHGIDVDRATSVSIEIGRYPDSHEVGAWADVTWYKATGLGQRYVNPTGDAAAEGRSSIPLRSFPRLTELPSSRPDGEVRPAV